MTSRCDAPPCHYAKLPRRRWCKRHDRAFLQHGHWAGKAVPRGTIEQYKVTALAFLERHRDTNEQIDTAIDWADHFLETCGDHGWSRKHGLEVRRLFQRLREEGVDGLALLTTVLAVWSISHRDEGLLPSDQRLTYAIGRAVAMLVPRPFVTTYTSGHPVKRYRDFSTVLRRKVGREVRDVLGLFLAQSMKAADSEIVALQERARSLALPFSPIT